MRVPARWLEIICIFIWLVYPYENSLRYTIKIWDLT